ncbi:MAG: hypothetical protein JST92_18520 [Deltaproteobacteria bacterium]|nr:hypothetical protein [Deltaproteobacteria bacterium]
MRDHGGHVFNGTFGTLGLCQPTCRFFNSGDCAQTCNPVRALGGGDYAGLCRAPGQVVLGASCEDDGCESGLACVPFSGGRKCAKLCQSSTDCSGGTCQMDLGLASGVGYCTVVP